GSRVLRDLHLDRPGLRLGLLREGDGEDAVLSLRLDPLRVERAGQREGPGERPVGPLDAVVVLPLVLLLELPLAPDGEDAVLEPDVHVLRLDAGELEAERHRLLVLVDVAGGGPPDGLAGAEDT